jgi:hypothetical protein
MITFLTNIIETFIFFYAILKLYSNYDKNILLSVVAMINYIFFGLSTMIYISLINLIVMHHMMIPKFLSIAKYKYQKSNISKRVNLYYQRYSIDNIRNVILFIGDSIMTVLKTLFLALLIKFNIQPANQIIPNPIDNVPVKKQKEELKQIEDELLDIQKINSELDKLLYIGKKVVSSVTDGGKEIQSQNVELFMDGFGKLMKDLKGEKND